MRQSVFQQFILPGRNDPDGLFERRRKHHSYHSPVTNDGDVRANHYPHALFSGHVRKCERDAWGAGNFAIVYDFWKSGTAVNTTLGTYTHVTTTTATTAKATFGTLVSITVNTPAAGTISVFDLATASCTGTPATNVVAVITATATAPFGTFAYNHAMLNGICVKASVAMDFTVSTQ